MGFRREGARPSAGRVRRPGPSPRPWRAVAVPRSQHGMDGIGTVDGRDLTNAIVQTYGPAGLSLTRARETLLMTVWDTMRVGLRTERQNILSGEAPHLAGSCRGGGTA